MIKFFLTNRETIISGYIEELFSFQVETESGHRIHVLKISTFTSNFFYLIELFVSATGRVPYPNKLVMGPITELHKAAWWCCKLKHAYDLSDEEVVARWVENPYWQWFCGFEYFQHELPCDPSSLTRWRQRIGPEGMEKLLAETVWAGVESGAVKPSSG